MINSTRFTIKRQESLKRSVLSKVSRSEPSQPTVVSGSPEVRKVTLHLFREETLTGRTGFAFIFFQLTRACGMCDTACLFISLSAVFGRRLKLNTVRLRKENGGEASFT
jgi:hypothetical protein